MIFGCRRLPIWPVTARPNLFQFSRPQQPRQLTSVNPQIGNIPSPDERAGPGEPQKARTGGVAMLRFFNCTHIHL